MLVWRLEDGNLLILYSLGKVQGVHHSGVDRSGFYNKRKGVIKRT